MGGVAGLSDKNEFCLGCCCQGDQYWRLQGADLTLRMSGQGSVPSLPAWLDGSLAALHLPAAQEKRMGGQMRSGLATAWTNPMAAQGLLPSSCPSDLWGQTGQKIKGPQPNALGTRRLMSVCLY